MNQSKVEAEKRGTFDKRGDAPNLCLARENIQPVPSARKYATCAKRIKHAACAKRGKTRNLCELLSAGIQYWFYFCSENN